MILKLVEVSHANFAKVPRVVFVEIGAVMMLSTRHTASTRVLTVLAYSAVTGGDMAATMELKVSLLRMSFT